MGLGREEFASNTDALIRAVEMADECDTILILYQKKETSGGNSGFFHVGETTNADLLWVVKRFELHLLGALAESED
jgi:hypothetical protein